MEISWLQFKAFIQSRSLSIQWVIIGSNYYLKAFDSSFELLCVLPSDSSLSTDSLDFETNFKALGNKQISSISSPFASKTLANGTKLFKRYCGIQSVLAIGTNTIIYTVPYPQVKIIGLDVMYAEALDTVSLYILDTITGTYSTIPNYVLNQFGSNVNISKDFFRQESNYDADLYQGMQIKLVYNSQSAKTVGINFNLSEVK